MPNNTEIEDKKTEINFNNKNILLHSSITFPLNPGGVGGFCNFGFGLREKLGNFGNLDFPEGGGILQLWIWT